MNLDSVAVADQDLGDDPAFEVLDCPAAAVGADHPVRHRTAGERSRRIPPAEGTDEQYQHGQAGEYWPTDAGMQCGEIRVGVFGVGGDRKRGLSGDRSGSWRDHPISVGKPRISPARPNRMQRLRDEIEMTVSQRL